MGQYGNVIFIVWRESIEALLVIGILQAWLGQQGGGARPRAALSLGRRRRRASSPPPCSATLLLVRRPARR